MKSKSELSIHTATMPVQTCLAKFKVEKYIVRAVEKWDLTR
jgi:hypothetical protein